jgi:hypothetical protein
MFDQALTGEPMMHFEWYDEHSVIPDGGWTIAHEEEEINLNHHSLV